MNAAPRLTIHEPSHSLHVVDHANEAGHDTRGSFPAVDREHLAVTSHGKGRQEQ